MDNNDIYYNALTYVLFKVTPALRYIYIDIQRSEHTILLICYFENYPNDLEKELMNDVADNILALIDMNFKVKCQFIVTQDHFDKIFKTPYPLFARYEE